MASARGTEPAVRRRTLLAAALAGLTGASACGRSVGSPSATPGRPEQNATLELTGQRPFYLAARAGARDWPEMSLYAFEQAAALPELQAVDLSVCRTADGVLVCSSDLTTERLTGASYTILDETWSTLSKLQITAAETVDPTQPPRPMARLEEVLERFGDRFVFFVEPRVKEAIPNLMATLIAANRPDRIVWKQPVNSGRFAEARSHGFATWGYVLDEPAHTGGNLQTLASSPEITMIGTSAKQDNAFISDVVAAGEANGKPVIGYGIIDGSSVRRMWRLGCTGLASAEITKVLQVPIPER